MQSQSSLGRREINRVSPYGTTKIGKVAGVKDYHKLGRIDVIFLDYSASLPVWVIGDIDKVPSEGDLVTVGYMEGRQDSPYLVGYVRNESYNCNNIIIGKDFIRLQLPANAKDRKEKMLNDASKASRPYIELTEAGKVVINGPKGVELKGSSITANGKVL